MNPVFVFSGTSEGREVCERLSKEGVLCRVFVATQYGMDVMEKDPCVDVSVGRLDASQIVELIKKESPEYVIDATHPHAEIVTQNIISACETMKISDKYIRVQRQISNSKIESENVIYVKSCSDALNYLVNNSTGNIMLTTGVKELESFWDERIKDRLVVRILPGIESLEIAHKLGVPSKAIIAMEGPFSEEMNIALIDKYNAKYLVTKNSGARGGFSEKISACEKTGARAIVIDNEAEYSDGLSVEETVHKVIGLSSRKHVYLIGCGVCNEKCLTLDAKNSIKKADILIGAKRMVEFGKTLNENAKVFYEYTPDKVCEIIDSLKESDKNIAVLFSGDTGFYSGSKGVLKQIETSDKNIDVEVIPGISSVSYFSSKIGIPYSDYPLISMHGKDCDYRKVLEENRGFFALSTGRDDVKKVIGDIGNNGTVYAGFNLGYSDERIFTDSINISDLPEGLYVICVLIK